MFGRRISEVCLSVKREPYPWKRELYPRARELSPGERDYFTNVLANAGCFLSCLRAEIPDICPHVSEEEKRPIHRTKETYSDLANDAHAAVDACEGASGQDYL